jgi:hypothetical protein
VSEIHIKGPSTMSLGCSSGPTPALNDFFVGDVGQNPEEKLLKQQNLQLS